MVWNLLEPWVPQLNVLTLSPWLCKGHGLFTSLFSSSSAYGARDDLPRFLIHIMGTVVLFHKIVEQINWCNYARVFCKPLKNCIAFRYYHCLRFGFIYLLIQQALLMPNKPNNVIGCEDSEKFSEFFSGFLIGIFVSGFHGSGPWALFVVVRGGGGHCMGKRCFLLGRHS